MKGPKYIVTLDKPKVLEPAGRIYDFEDGSAARMFRELWGGFLFKNVNGNYLKIK